MMRGKIIAACVLLAAPMALAPAAAQDAPAEDSIVDSIINVPAPQGLRVDGLRNKPKPRSDDSVQGGKALRIAVPAKSDQAWSIAVASPITKPVKAGDRLVLAFWARLEKGEDGAASATLPYNSVQLAREPYSAVFGGPVTITPEWKLHEIDGKADKDYAAGDLVVSLHLASAKQTVDIGPVFVLDMGQ